MKLLRVLAFPFTFLYGSIVRVRNYLYDKNIFRSNRFDSPVIGIGNLSVGGTGKTPHIEYLIRLLKTEGIEIAVLSRGYKRLSKGYVEAIDESTIWDIGDEPKQIKNKFKNEVTVAVDSNRVRGIAELFGKTSPPDVVLLDDCLQHRAIDPGLKILLTDYQSPYCEDYLLPSGNLREPRCGADRADIIIVTKTPKVLSPLEVRRIHSELKVKEHQQLFFSSISYGGIHPLFDDEEPITDLNQVDEILLVTGIANPTYLLNYLETFKLKIKHLKYRDHYAFMKKDLMTIREAFEGLSSNKKLILTTEKDAMRIIDHKFNDIVNEFPFYFQEIEITLRENREEFDKRILDYVREHKRND